jgi:hypothetical protein
MRKSSLRRHRASPPKTHRAALTDLELAHGGQASIFTGKPSFRVLQSSDQAKRDPIAGLDDVAFRAAHREHFQLLGVMPLSPEQEARLGELNAIIETERDRRALRRSSPPTGHGVLVEVITASRRTEPGAARDAG